MSDQDHSNLEGDAEERAGAGDPASSHGSDLDARIPSGEDRPDQPLGADDAGR